MLTCGWYMPVNLVQVIVNIVDIFLYNFELWMNNIWLKMCVQYMQYMIHMEMVQYQPTPKNG